MPRLFDKKMHTKKKKNTQQERSRRSDGELTRIHIFEVAGQLFAENGYANTTSKEICERAKTNIAAINYHFGSRDQLYLLLLEKAYNDYNEMQLLKKIDDEPISSKEKLERLFDVMLQKAMRDDGWQTRMLLRELIDPTPVMKKQITQSAMEKMEVLTGWLSDITQIPVTDNRLLQCVILVISPIVTLLLTKRETQAPFSPLFSTSSDALKSQMKRFIFAGLDAEK